MPMAVTKCPRCQGPRDPQNPKPAHMHQCGCLVKWDKEALVPALVHQVLSISRNELVWEATGCVQWVEHPIRETAIAMWREKVWAAK